MNEKSWARLLAYVAGLINQELLLKNEYLREAFASSLQVKLQADEAGYALPVQPRRSMLLAR